MRVLVSGGAGFIGSHYVPQVVSGAYPALADADVVVLDKLTYAGNEENCRPNRSSWTRSVTWWASTWRRRRTPWSLRSTKNRRCRRLAAPRRFCRS